MSQTTTRILDFIQERYPSAELDAADDIFSVGYVNSLFAMELVMFIEKTFALAIPNDELRLDNFRTAVAMSDLIGRLAEAPVGAAT